MTFKTLLEKFDLKTIAIIALIIALILTRACSSDPIPGDRVTVDGKDYIQVKHTVDTVFVNTTKTVYKPGKTIWRTPPHPGKIPQNLDTLKIVEDFYSTYVYKDTLTLDDHLGFITTTDTVTQNQIKGRTYKASINQKIIHETTIVKELPKTQVYVGGVAGFDKVNIVNFVGPSLLLKTKQDHIYSLGVGVGINKSISVQGVIYWKIKL